MEYKMDLETETDMTTIKYFNMTSEPEPLECEFCGKRLPYRPFGNPITKLFWRWMDPVPCDCADEQARQDLLKQEAEEVERRKEAAERMKRIDKLFDISKMGRRFKDRIFENFKTDKTNEIAFNKAFAYAENFKEHKRNGEGLLLVGTVGTGKTHLAASIAHYLITNLTPVIFGNVTTLLGRIRETYSGEGSEHEIMDSLLKTDLLIIDDLGKEQTTDWVLEKLYSIINARYEDYKPIIATTNLNPKDLEKKIGEAAFSRLVEMCQGIKMDGSDFRKGKLR